MINLEKMLEMACDVVGGSRYREDYYTNLYNAVLAYVPEGGRVLEIGTHKGNSAIAMGCAAHGRGIEVHTVDPLYRTGSYHFADCNNKNGYTFHNSEEDFCKRIADCGLAEVVTLHANTSQELLEVWERPLDLVLIDGAHTYEDVLIDCGWLDKIKPFGFAMFDDWLQEVSLAVIRFISDRPEWSFIYQSTFPSQGWMCTTTLRKN